MRDGNSLSTTPGHYIYVNDELVPASKARAGDFLTNSHGDYVVIDSIAHITKQGLCNPQTVHGDIIVDGIKASTFTDAVKFGAAQSILSPVRAVFRITGISIKYLENLPKSVKQYGTSMFHG